MERTERAAVVPADFGWSDVGSWSAVWDVLDHDAARQRASRARRSCSTAATAWCARDESVLTTVVGLDDVVVVATEDAVLVASRDKTEQVKELVEQLKAQNQRAAIEHRRIYRPWGYYQDIDLADALPGQAHRREARQQALAAEALPPLRALGGGEGNRRGHASATRCAACTKTSSIYIPIGSVHRLANPGRIPLELIEVQVGSYVGEDDIVRLDDVYGRRIAGRARPLSPAQRSRR